MLMILIHSIQMDGWMDGCKTRRWVEKRKRMRIEKKNGD